MGSPVRAARLLKCATLERAPGGPMMVCLELICGNCGALNVVNVVSRQKARELAGWCQVCEDDQDTAMVMAHTFVEVLPAEDPPYP